MIFDPRFDWRKPYRRVNRHGGVASGWRTNLRIILPRPLCWLWLLDKGRDCESAGSHHDWYNKDNEISACYHCHVVRPGQLWKAGK